MTGDRDLTDEALREEIELVGELVVAATASPGRMGQAEVDQVLGVDGTGDRPVVGPRVSRSRSAAGRTR